MSGYACFPVGQLQANCWLVWDDEFHAVLIDPGDEASRLLRALNERGLVLSAILLTHVHFDHMMAVKALQQATAAPLLVHEADAPALTDSQKSLTAWLGVTCNLTADRLLKEGDTVTAGTLTFTVYHTPGHTPGSCCFQTENWLFTGDTLFAGSIGRTDFPGGNSAAMRQSLRRLAALPEEWLVLPGHEETSTIGIEKQTNGYMV